MSLIPLHWAVSMGHIFWWAGLSLAGTQANYVPSDHGKKVLARHDPSHRAAARACKLTTTLPGATVTADTSLSMTDRVCDLEICLCTFIAEHDLSFTIS